MCEYYTKYLDNSWDVSHPQHARYFNQRITGIVTCGLEAFS